MPAGGVPEKEDGVRIAAELGDVGHNPIQGRGKVGRGRGVPALRHEAVPDADQDETLAGQPLRLAAHPRLVAARPTPAMNVDEDRTRRCPRSLWSVDVESPGDRRGGQRVVVDISVGSGDEGSRAGGERENGEK